MSDLAKYGYSRVCRKIKNGCVTWGAADQQSKNHILQKEYFLHRDFSVGRLSISPTSIARVQCAVHLKRFRSFVSIRIVAFYSDCHVVHPRWRRACALPSAMNTIARVLPLPAFDRGRCSPTERQRLIYVLLTSAGFFFYIKKLRFSTQT